MNSFTDGSAFCPGAPKRVPSDSEKHRRVYTSSNVCHSHEWLPAKLSKNGMRVYTLSDRRSKKKLRVYTASEAKGLNKFINKTRKKCSHLYISCHDLSLWVYMTCNHTDGVGDSVKDAHVCCFPTHCLEAGTRLPNHVQHPARDQL